MITSVSENSVTKEKTFQCTDDKSGETFERIVKKEIPDMVVSLSNTEAAFSDKTIEEFKKWLSEKKYAARDCWCKHIAEFAKEVKWELLVL